MQMFDHMWDEQQEKLSVYFSHSLRSAFPPGSRLWDASSNHAAFPFIGFLLCTLKPPASFVSKMKL